MIYLIGYAKTDSAPLTGKLQHLSERYLPIVGICKTRQIGVLINGVINVFNQAIVCGDAC